jgi:hypothetical protein
VNACVCSCRETVEDTAADDKRIIFVVDIGLSDTRERCWRVLRSIDNADLKRDFL